MTDSANATNSPAGIHPTAVIDPAAVIGQDVAIGPYAVIGPAARIGDRTTIGAGAFIGPWTAIGPDNRIYHHATVGSDSQALAYQPGVESYLELGAANIVREYATLNRASDPGGATHVGDNNCFMAYSHVAHNCLIGNGVIFANNVAIGGHVVIEDNAILGGLTGVHQFCRVGRHAILGSNSKVNRDVLPFITVDGHPAQPRGINAIGLKRHGFAPDAIRQLREAYKILFLRGLPIKEALEQLTERFPASPHVLAIVDFVQSSTRGILRTRKRASSR